MKTATNRDVFLKGMEVMMNVKQQIMHKRDLVAKSKKIIESHQGSEDLDEIKSFYQSQILNIQKEIAKSKEVALCFINTHKEQHPESVAIFEKEYAELPE